MMLDVFYPQGNFPVLPTIFGYGYHVSRLHCLQVMMKSVVSVEHMTLLTCSDRYGSIRVGTSPSLRQMAPERCV